MSEPAQEKSASGSRIAVIDKAARVLDILMEVPTGLMPTEMASALGSNRSTAFRLLTSLEQAGLLSRDRLSGRYRLGPKFLQYGEAVRAGTALIDIAEPTLRRLSVAAQQSVTLAIREGFGARWIHRIAGPDIEVLAWKVGGWLPLHMGAAPKALLSTLSDAELVRFFAEDVERRNLHGILTEEDIRADIAETRRLGYSLDREGLTAGVFSLGAAVRNASGTPVCAISAAGLEHHYRGDALEETAAAVMGAAEEIGRLLP